MSGHIKYPVYAHTPNIVTMLNSIGADGEVMKMLGISHQTLVKWRKKGACPLPAHYAIFWVTMWGRSHLESEASRDAAMAHLNSTAIERENRALKQQLALLEDRLAHGDRAANAPLIRYGRG